MSPSTASIALLVSVALLLAATPAEGFAAGGMMLRGATMQRAALSARPQVSLGLRMSSEGGGEEKDPYVVEVEKPSFAKDAAENQWAKDLEAGESKEDGKKKFVAMSTGAVALALGVVYLLAVAALESRGPLKPPPPEALIGSVQAISNYFA